MSRVTGATDASASTIPSSGASTATVTLAIFQLGGQDYAIDILAVKEIVARTPVTPVPSAPHGLEGLIELRGAILPVVDLALVLALPVGARTRVILCRQGDDGLFGLVVDGVREVIRLERARLGPAPAGAPPAFTASFATPAPGGERVVLVLDPMRAVPPALRQRPAATP